MKKLIDLIQEELVKAFTAAEMDPSYARVSVSNRPDLCEYQCNGAMAAAKAYHKAPIQLAEAVVEKVTDHSVIGEIEAVKPGFINLKINPEFLADYLSKMQNDEDLSVEKAKNPKTIIVDYGGANVAKPLHVGHLRSAIIGESIKRMGRFMGHNMIGDVHLGDWGLQMGLIITELQERHPRNSIWPVCRYSTRAGRSCPTPTRRCGRLLFLSTAAKRKKPAVPCPAWWTGSRMPP